MKGTITTCLAELVETKFGAERWTAILDAAGVDAKLRPRLKMATSDVDDAVALALLEATSRVLGVTPRQAADAFGEHWCCEYAPKVYKAVMSRFEDARQMILGLDALHLRMTTMIQNARPPRFDCRWLDERTLEVTYKSHRPLLEIYMGLARGVGKYFGEPLKVDAVGGSRVRIEFA